MPDISTSEYIDKKRGHWVARMDWYDAAGKRLTRKRRADNRAHAQELTREWRTEMKDHGEEFIRADAMTFADLAARYEQAELIPPIYRDERKVAGLRDAQGQKRRLRQLVEHFGDRRIRAITAADIKAFKNARLQMPVKKTGKERSLADVHRALSLLKAVFTFAVTNHLLTRNPVKELKDAIVTAHEVTRTRALSLDEQRRLLEACRAPERLHIYPLVLCALDSGARRNELLTLRWKDFDLMKGTITITATNAKTNKQRVIELEPLTLEELKHLKGISASETVFGLKHFRRAFESALKAAGIDDARFHDLRATAISGWLMRGMRTESAMARSGHKVYETFLKYVRLSEEMRAKERERMTEWELPAMLPAFEREEAEWPDELTVEMEYTRSSP